MSLGTKIDALSDLFVLKLNELFANKEAKNNKQQDLTSANPEHYASVPAINTGLMAAKARANHTGTQQMSTISGLAQALIDAKKRNLHTGTQPASTISDFDAVVNSLIYALAGAANGLAELGPDGKLVPS